MEYKGIPVSLFIFSLFLDLLQEKVIPTNNITTIIHLPMRIKGGDNARTNEFLQKTRSNLSLAVRSDRLSVLSEPKEYNGQKVICKGKISPRYAVPSDYRLYLIPTQDSESSKTDGSVYQVKLEYKTTGGWSAIPDIEAHFLKHSKVDLLLNVPHALRFAVLVCEGHKALYQSFPRGKTSKESLISIKLTAINRDGNVMEGNSVNSKHRLDIIGFNQNMRMILLERHVRETPNSELMFEPLQHLIGIGVPRAVNVEMKNEITKSYFELNEEQRSVANPQYLKSAMEVAGPPGTGKTKTIVELVRALLHCTDYDILVLSERNGAINAIAEKIMDESLKIKGNGIEIIDFQVWQSVMTYGSAETMGEYTKLFTLEEKLKAHPEVVAVQEQHGLLTATAKKLSYALLRKLLETFQFIADHFKEDIAVTWSYLREKYAIELSCPVNIISAVKQATEDLTDLLQKTKVEGNWIFGSKYVPEKETTDMIARHSTLLGHMISTCSDEKQDKNCSTQWDAKEVTKRLCFIEGNFRNIVALDMFNFDHAQNLNEKIVSLDKEYIELRARLEDELPRLARLNMSTIGSSNRLPVSNKKDEDDNFENKMECLAQNHAKEESKSDFPRKTICIFDESGCIPAYELLGLSRLGKPIKALILVGDKQQLPPYDPMQGRSFRRSDTMGKSRRNRRKQTTKNVTKIHSLLDVSVLTAKLGKVLLTKQYRVPRDIAEILNSKVYQGQYITCPKATVPLSGLQMVHVASATNTKMKYVNSNEVKEGINLLQKFNLIDDICSALVITPYKNQQREFQLQLDKLKKSGQTIHTTVLTIDQCQGQEADAVILSLVQKPTQFMTLNRLNVALSRVRKKLYVLTDYEEFQKACRNNNWESAHLAKHLLTKWHSPTDTKLSRRSKRSNHSQ